ncbi:Kelch repeat-containing protein [Chondromyces apiculatus]|uniref:Uncharacterized protein n=1 Tax=Chondromyces apiculatus DSM 436 TaxID=1192034 RepID=A0A017T0Z2_9BACT|nr:kelch repeat-containing protein [Chondromyces apiculatus]EYF02893.1 Hypothetical protein CAP_6473 [Chondromyces apiculatus DSM 436]
MPHAPLLCRLASLALPVLGAGMPVCVLGCAEESAPLDARSLGQYFPDQAEAVLHGHPAFGPGVEGFQLPGSEEDPGAPARGLEARLPARGDGSLHLALPDGFAAQVREVGALGDGTLVEDAVAYGRPGGTSFWVATDDGGYEEWLLLDAATVRRDRPVAAWDVEGATLRQRGEGVQLADAAGTARMLVTAPAAYALGGRPVKSRLEASGGRMALWVEAEQEAVLVDPKWIELQNSRDEQRLRSSVTPLRDGRVLIAGGARFTGSFVPPQGIASAEVFDPEHQSWTPVAPMSTGRWGHAAIVLHDGRILVAGGLTTGGPGGALIAGAEVFDPISGTWTATASPVSAPAHDREFTLLDDGRVLATGGGRANDEGPVDHQRAEVFDPVLNTWADLPSSMGVDRVHHTATVLRDGRVLLAGGRTEAGISASAELFDPRSSTWTQLSTPMNLPRSRHGATLLLDGRVLVAGSTPEESPADESTRTAEIFDPETGTWSLLHMKADHGEIEVTRLRSGLVLVSNTGVSQLSRPEMFDPQSQEWTLTPFFPITFYNPRATRLKDGRVLFTSLELSTTSMLLFDERSSPWSLLQPMRSPSFTSSSAGVPGPARLPEGRVLFTATSYELNDAGQKVGALSTPEFFDPETRSWSFTSPPVAPPHEDQTLTRLGDGTILATGGRTLVNTLVSGAAELFEPQLGTWSLLPPMQTARIRHTATLLDDGRVFVTGGENAGGLQDTAEMFEPGSRTWTSISATMSTGRTLHATTRLGDGRRLLVLGGDTGEGGTSTAEMFDVETQTWEQLPPMSMPRRNPTAALLEDGRVLVGGGTESAEEGHTSSVELFDPEARTWTLLPPMHAARDAPAATLLGDGRVLVVGGAEGGIESMRAEVFNPESRVWTSTGTVEGLLSKVSATLLEDGQVLVAGYSRIASDRTPIAALFEPLSLGADCSSSADCASGFCREGVCCDAICNDGLCATCLKSLGAVQEGICTPLHACAPYVCRPETGGCADPCEAAEDCTPEYFCHDGACIPLLDNGEGCQADADCRSGFCTEGVCCNEACDGNLCERACSTKHHAPANGTCVDVTPPCAPYSCDGSSGACLTSCTSADGCSPGLVCAPSGACVPPPPGASFLDRSSCSVSVVSSPGSSRVPAVPALLLAAGVALGRGRRRRRERRALT